MLMVEQLHLLKFNFEFQNARINLERILIYHCIKQHQILLSKLSQLLKLNNKPKLNMRYVNKQIPTHNLLPEKCTQFRRQFLDLTLHELSYNLVTVPVVHALPAYVIRGLGH